LKYKVLLDTNVLVAASTFNVSQDWKMRVKHPFYEQSRKLVEFLKRNLEKRIGIVTKTIENQAPGALEKAVTIELQKKKIDRAVDFEIFSAIQNACEKRLSDILACLLREPVNEEAVHQNYVVVDKMYEELAAQAVKMYIAKPAKKWVEAAARRFRRIARPIYMTQQRKLDWQLFNLIHKPVESSDKRILAEAVYLSMLFNRTETEDVAFYIASTDRHFSPARWAGGIKSTQVTDRIKEKFGIVCDWPHQIEETLRGKIS